MAAKKFVAPDGYVSIRTTLLVPDHVVNVPIYVLINSRAVAWILSGEIVEKKRLDKLVGFKVRKILIRAEDELSFQKYLENIFDETLQDASVDFNDRTAVAAAFAETAAEHLLENTQDKESFMRAQKYFEQFGKMLSDSSTTQGLVSQAVGTPWQDTHMDHSVRVASLSVSLADRLGLLKSEADRTVLVTACYLHDGALDMDDTPRDEVHKNFEKFKNEKSWLSHPVKGATLFQGLDYVNPRVLQIIAQHEEIPNGDGFPQGLLGKKMDPLSVVVSMVNRFEHSLYLCQGDYEKALEAFMRTELGRFDLDQLTILKKIVSEKMGLST